MQQVDFRAERRGRSAAGSAQLPQFDLQAWEAVDPDRTLERLPALSSTGTSRVSSPAAPHREAYAPIQDSESDLAATVEIVPEVSVGDILESEPSRPALALPPRVSVPIDLNRLLAQARAEASRSPEFFHVASAPATAPFLAPRGDEPASVGSPSPAVASPWQARPSLVSSLATERTRHRRPPSWVLGTAVVAAAVTVLVAAGLSRTSSARSPSSVTVVRSAAPASAPRTPVTFRTAAAPDDAPPIPAVSVQNLPRVESATISIAAVAASHRLFVDGKLVDGGSAVVSCGSHVIQVGARGARRRVNVPCGQELVVAK